MRKETSSFWSPFASLGEPPVTCEAVLTETCWHLRAAPEAVARVLEMRARRDLRLFPIADVEGVALAGLVRKYGKRMDLADAGLVRLAELFPNASVITTDVVDFSV